MPLLLLPLAKSWKGSQQCTHMAVLSQSLWNRAISTAICSNHLLLPLQILLRVANDKETATETVKGVQLAESWVKAELIIFGASCLSHKWLNSYSLTRVRIASETPYIHYTDGTDSLQRDGPQSCQINVSYTPTGSIWVVEEKRDLNPMVPSRCLGNSSGHPTHQAVMGTWEMESLV